MSLALGHDDLVELLPHDFIFEKLLRRASLLVLRSELLKEILLEHQEHHNVALQRASGDKALGSDAGLHDHVLNLLGRNILTLLQFENVFGAVDNFEGTVG